MAKRITSEEFDAKFDAGEDLDEYLDYDAITVEDPDPRDVLLSLPEWAIATADAEAKRRNVTRRAVLNTWITDKADEVRRRATA